MEPPTVVVYTVPAAGATMTHTVRPGGLVQTETDSSGDVVVETLVAGSVVTQTLVGGAIYTKNLPPSKATQSVEVYTIAGPAVQSVEVVTIPGSASSARAKVS